MARPLAGGDLIVRGMHLSGHKPRFTGGHSGGASEDSGGQWHRLWIPAAARPCGGGTVVVDPSGTAFVGVWGAAVVDAAAVARARQRSAGRARERVGRQPSERAGDVIAVADLGILLRVCLIFSYNFI
jgi:hypothetical protein